MDEVNKLSANLALLLNRSNLSAAELSRLSGIPRQSISDWMAGRSPRKLAHLKKVSEILGCSVDVLCFGEMDSRKTHSSLDCMKAACPVVRSSDPIMILNNRGGVLENSQWLQQKIGPLALPGGLNSFLPLVHFSDRVRTRKLVTATVESGMAPLILDQRILGIERKFYSIRWTISMSQLDPFIFAIGKDLSATFPPEMEQNEMATIQTIVQHMLDLASTDRVQRSIILRSEGPSESIWLNCSLTRVSGLVWAFLTFLADASRGRATAVLSYGKKHGRAFVRVTVESGGTTHYLPFIESPIKDWIRDTDCQVHPVLTDHWIGLEFDWPLA